MSSIRDFPPELMQMICRELTCKELACLTLSSRWLAQHRGIQDTWEQHCADTGWEYRNERTAAPAWMKPSEWRALRLTERNYRRLCARAVELNVTCDSAAIGRAIRANSAPRPVSARKLFVLGACLLVVGVYLAASGRPFWMVNAFRFATVLLMARYSLWDMREFLASIEDGRSAAKSRLEELQAHLLQFEKTCRREWFFRIS